MNIFFFLILIYIVESTSLSILILKLNILHYINIHNLNKKENAPIKCFYNSKIKINKLSEKL